MADVGDFAVLRLGARDDAAAKCLADGLMAEADNVSIGHLAGRRGDKVETDAGLRSACTGQARE